MINPLDPKHRQRLSESINYWDREHERYRQARRETILLHSGSSAYAETMTGQKADPQWGNLIQLSALSHVVTLAYNDPEYACVAEIPEADDIAPRLEELLNRYSALLGIGNIGRSVALDSFFGFGIIMVENGLLPPRLRHRVRQPYGPMMYRVSQDYFGFDGDATSWDDVSYIYSLHDVPLDDVKAFAPYRLFNPQGLADVQEHEGARQNQDGRIHTGVGRNRTAQPMARLLKVYLPHSNMRVTWAVNGTARPYDGVASVPLLAEPWTGHHSGPYGVMSHLDIPDNLLPIAQVDSVKQLHYLFNQLMDITSNQALRAYYHPLYEVGSDEDIKRIENAKDRDPVGVRDINRVGSIQKPGPDQSQSAHMHAALAMFKEFGGNLDDTLGLAPTAATATQSQLIRSRTTARGAEARRRMDSLMLSAATKLGHLALNDPTLTFRMRKQLGKTTFLLDRSWYPPSLLFRDGIHIDDFKLTIIEDSMSYRSTDERLEQLKAATADIFQAAQGVAAGIPLDLEEFVETQAKYRRLPELRKWYKAVLPEYMQRLDTSRQATMRRPGTGEYIRRNVSERSNGGALTQLLTQQPQQQGPTQQ